VVIWIFSFLFEKISRKNGSLYVLLNFDQILKKIHLIFSFIGHEQGVAIAIC
jgi:hypothetical protein